MGDTADDTTQVATYQAASQHWAHAEQIRWTLLYNYLMASTILLLAWATIFAAQGSITSRDWILAALAAAGALLSALWVALGARATGFVKMYAATGEGLEANLAPPKRGSSIRAPFAAAAEHRGSVTGVARLAPSHVVLWAVPSLFLLLYLGLLYLSALGVLAPGRSFPWYVPASAGLLYLAYAGISLKHALRPGATHYKQLIVGAGVLIEKDHKLLLLKRAREPFAGSWGLPGGHVEASEDPEHAAIREAEEETGLKVTSRGLAGAYYFDDHPRGHGVFLVYRCVATGGAVKAGEEVATAKFFAPAAVPSDRAGGGHDKAIDAWLAASTGNPSGA